MTKKEDNIDGCEVDFDSDPVSDDDLDLFVLFPDGPDDKLEKEYKELWS